LLKKHDGTNKMIASCALISHFCNKFSMAITFRDFAGHGI